VYHTTRLQAIDVPVFDMGTDASPVDIAREGVAEARRRKMDAVIVDTAGRLQVCEKRRAR
jgi:signal recognition particle subunit SRP54